VDQIPVRSVDLKQVEARVARTSCAGSKLLNRFTEHILVHGDRRVEGIGVRQRRRGNSLPAPRARRDEFAAVPWRGRRPFAPRMPKLYASDSALRLYETHDARERALLIVRQAKAIWRNPAARLRMHDLSEYDSSAAHRSRREVLKMPVIGNAVSRRILAHRRYHDAVARCDRAQAHRLKQARSGCSLHHLALVFAVRGVRSVFFSAVHHLILSV